MGVTIKTTGKPPPSKYAKLLEPKEVLVSVPATAMTSIVKNSASSPVSKAVKETHTGETVHKGLMVPEAHALVRVGGSQTINTGNYNSVKISVDLTMPCAPQDIDATYEFATDWVSKKMAEAENKTSPF